MTPTVLDIIAQFNALFRAYRFSKKVHGLSGDFPIAHKQRSHAVGGYTAGFMS